MRALASRNEATARTAADSLGIPIAYGSYEALLADPQIEAIYNPLPNHLHVPLTLKAAAAGKHVLCEKPIAMTALEAEQLRSVAGKVLIAEAFMVRFHPQWLRARDLVREGRIGELRAVQMFFCYKNLDPSNIRNAADDRRRGAVRHRLLRHRRRSVLPRGGAARARSRSSIAIPASVPTG